MLITHSEQLSLYSPAVTGAYICPTLSSSEDPIICVMNEDWLHNPDHNKTSHAVQHPNYHTVYCLLLTLLPPLPSLFPYFAPAIPLAMQGESANQHHR